MDRSSFLVGAGLVLVELPTAIPYFAVIAAVIGSGKPAVAQVLLLVIFNVCFVLPLLAALAFRLFAGERARAWLARARGNVDEFLAKLAPGLVLLVALALIAFGARRAAQGVGGNGSPGPSEKRSDMVLDPSGACGAPERSRGSAGGTDFMEFDKFAIGFDHRDRERLHALWDGILDDDLWSDGPLVKAFEETWTAWNGLPSVATSSWTGSALAALEFFELRGKTVLCPSNTFMADPLAIVEVGAKVEFVDCNRNDLCMSFDDFERKVAKHKPAAAILVHIGGHLAFETEKIAALCKAEGIFLIEDCAHSHGASWNGRKPGTFGDVGLWSFAPTKTISTGEGGILVSANPDLVEYASRFRNYGKPDYSQTGLNYRMNEFTAAIGILGRRAARGDRRVEEPDRPQRARPAAPRADRAPGGDGLRALQVHRLRGARALDREGLRRALPPHHGSRGRSPEHRLGRGESLVRAALLPAGVHARAPGQSAR